MNEQITGDVAPGWGAVADVLGESIESGEDVGASVAVYHRGERVGDIAGGSFTRERGGRYDADARVFEPDIETPRKRRLRKRDDVVERAGSDIDTRRLDRCTRPRRGEGERRGIGRAAGDA